MQFDLNGGCAHGRSLDPLEKTRAFGMTPERERERERERWSRQIAPLLNQEST
jgi:hypothetical protein